MKLHQKLISIARRAACASTNQGSAMRRKEGEKGRDERRALAGSGGGSGAGYFRRGIFNLRARLEIASVERLTAFGRIKNGRGSGDKNKTYRAPCIPRRAAIRFAHTLRASRSRTPAIFQRLSGGRAVGRGRGKKGTRERKMKRLTVDVSRHEKIIGQIKRPWLRPCVSLFPPAALSLRS